MATDQKTTAVIAGGGPAGLTAAVELLRRTNLHPIVAEKSDIIGGISRTVEHNGNRIDIGGHRFFSKDPHIVRWWTDLLPMQDNSDHNPDTTDHVMLRRQRISRIFYLRRFFDYPISLKWQTFANMGLRRTIAAAAGFAKAAMAQRPEKSLEDFYINRFGKPLYNMFFEDYTTKVWGIHPSRLGADWGAQRVKGLSVAAVVKDMIAKRYGHKKDNSKVETSLIESFIYPKFGPGQLWELAGEEIVRHGGEIHMSTEVTGINISGNRVVSVTVTGPTGDSHDIACDHLLSTMPLKQLIASIHGIDIPDNVREIAAGLPYRDFITAGLLVDKLAINGTAGSCIPDTWIYIQERDVRLGRIQIFNNWSPYMVADPANTIWIGLEYFCNEGDAMWTMPDDHFIAMAADELRRIGFIDPSTKILDSLRINVEKAYPAYHGTYSGIAQVREFIDKIGNLWCIGRNGQHRYNNMDHSMLTAIKAVDAIAGGSSSKHDIWAVNTETDYHESNQRG